MKRLRYQPLLQSRSVSHSGTTRSDFEFPTTTGAFGAALPNDVVFCGKVINRRAEPGPEPQKEREGENLSGRAHWIRSPSGRESRCRRSESCGKRYNGMFGSRTVKFPLQMELGDIKMRQERREPTKLPKFTAADGGGRESCWELVRPLGRRGKLMSALLSKVSFGCFPMV